MSTLRQLRVQVRIRWKALNAREQLSISFLGALLVMWLFWAIAIAPALHTVVDSDHRHQQLDQQLSQMLALQSQAQILKSRPHLSREEILRHLQDLTPDTQIKLTVQGDHMSVQLKDVPAPTLVNWLAQARIEAQVLPIEAHLARNTTAAESDVAWNGTLVLSLPREGATP